MAFLDKNKIKVDAILTNKGKELLAKGQFKITQFALSDDEVDYTLYDPTHPLGSEYYGYLIENMPLLEAFPDETQSMKHKLITMPRSTYRIPTVSISSSQITLNTYRSKSIIAPQTSPPANTVLGYTCILHNSDAAILRVVRESQGSSGTQASYFDDVSEGKLEEDFQLKSVSAVGMVFELEAKLTPLQDIDTFITIIGNETGGRITVPLKVLKNREDNPASGSGGITPPSGTAEMPPPQD